MMPVWKVSAKPLQNDLAQGLAKIVASCPTTAYVQLFLFETKGIKEIIDAYWYPS